MSIEPPRNRRQSDLDSTAQALQAGKRTGPKCNRENPVRNARSGVRSIRYSFSRFRSVRGSKPRRYAGLPELASGRRATADREARMADRTQNLFLTPLSPL